MRQQDLARLVGTTQSAISDTMRGHTQPTLPMLRRIAAALGMEVRLGVPTATPDPTPDYARDVPPEVMSMAENVLLRIHELIDGAPHALAANAYRAGTADGYRKALAQITDAIRPALTAAEETQ